MPGRAGVEMRVWHVVRIWALLAVAAFAAGCGSDDSAPVLPIAPEGHVVVTEVRFGEYLVLTNTRDTAVDLAGFWLCNSPAYLELAGDLEPGESVRIMAGTLGGLSELGGEVGLFRSAEFAAPDAIVDYVAWGAGADRTPVAVQAGIWPSGRTVEVAGPGIVRTLVSSSPEAWVASE